MSSSMYLSLFLVTGCFILSLRIWFAIRSSKSKNTKVIRGREFLPLSTKEELLENIANKYDVLISDLSRNEYLQRYAVKYVIKHVNEYSRKEVIEALDYLYRWEQSNE